MVRGARRKVAGRLEDKYLANGRAEEESALFSATGSVSGGEVERRASLGRLPASPLCCNAFAKLEIACANQSSQSKRFTTEREHILAPS